MTISMDIRDEIERIRTLKDINQLNESTLQTSIVLPVLRALGWNTSDPDQVRLEHNVANHLKGRADIALLGDHKPLALIETKAPRRLLENVDKYRNQLFEYCRLLQITSGVLSNGKEWYFYYLGDSTIPADVIDLLKDDIPQSAAKLRRFLSREKILDGSARSFTEEALTQRILNREWKKLLTEGDRQLVARLRKEVKITSNVSVSLSQVAGFLKGRADLPSATHSIEQSMEVAETNTAATSTQLTKPDNVSSRVSAPSADVTATSTQSTELPKDQSHTKQRPTHIQAFGKRIECATWKSVLVEFLLELYARHPDLFQRLTDAPKRSVPYQPKFAQDREKLRSVGVPRKIGESGYWVETWGGRKGTEQYCRAVQQLLNLPEDTLVIHSADIVATSTQPAKPPKDQSHTKQQPTHIQAFGKRIECATWKSVLVEFLTELHASHPDLFQRLTDAPKRSVPYQPKLAKDREKLRSMRAPRKIGESGYWVETKASSDAIEKHCRAVQQLFNLPEDTLVVHSSDQH